MSPNVVTVRLIEGSKALCIERSHNDDTPMAISIIRRLAACGILSLHVYVYAF